MFKWEHLPKYQTWNLLPKKHNAYIVYHGGVKTYHCYVHHKFIGHYETLAEAREIVTRRVKNV